MRFNDRRTAAWGSVWLISFALMVGCGLVAPPEESEPQLTFEAEAYGVGDSIRYTMMVTNRSSEDAELVARECRRFGALIATGGNGDGSWDERAWSTAAGGCWPVRVVQPVRAHDTEEISSTVSIGQILGDSLPDGRYSLMVVPDFAEPEVEVAELPAGEVELRR